MTEAEKTISILEENIEKTEKPIEKIYVSSTLYDALIDNAFEKGITYYNLKNTNESFRIPRAMLYNFSSIQTLIVEDYIGEFCKTDFSETAYKIKYKERD